MRFRFRRSSVQRQVSSLHTYIHFVTIRSQERTLFDADALHGLENADRMRAVNQQDRIALSQNDFPKTIAAVGKEINRNDALLDDKHLLCIVDPALDFKMVVSLFDETGLMGQQPELKRRALRREEYALVDARTGPDDLGISPAIMLNHFETHSATPSIPCQVKTIGSEPRAER